MIDKRTVELAKVRDSQGANVSQIARELNKSPRTIGRYLQLDDDPEFAEELVEIRRANQTKCITDCWWIIHAAAAVEKEKISRCSAKEAAVIKGINLDKVQMLETRGIHKVEEDSKTTFIFQVIDGNTSKALPEPGGVPQFPGEVQGDDRGKGKRENVLALPGGNQNQS
jgi:hypothetical protein